MKNRIYWCICGFCSLIVVFTFAYYFSFNQSLSKARDEEAKKSNAVYEKNADAVSAKTNSKDRIDKDAKYVEQSYDLADSEYCDRQLKLPNEYIGMSKQELEKQLREYVQNSSAEDKKKGLLYATVISFSKNAVTIRKVYDNKANYKYYISVKDGYVVVYANDKKTIVDETGIAYKDLADSQKQEVDQGVYVDDLSQLYCALESYTS